MYLKILKICIVGYLYTVLLTNLFNTYLYCKLCVNVMMTVIELTWHHVEWLQKTGHLDRNAE